MKDYTKTIIIVVIVLIGLFLSLRFGGEKLISQFSSNTENSLEKSIDVQKEAPYFDLLSLSGEMVNRADTQDYPIVLTFWASWNPESIDQLKIFDDYFTSLSPEEKESSVRLITINSQESLNTVENIIRRGSYRLEVLVDMSGETSSEYGVQNLPTTFFINKNGEILETFVGTLSQKMFVDKIESIIQ